MGKTMMKLSVALVALMLGAILAPTHAYAEPPEVKIEIPPLPDFGGGEKKAEKPKGDKPKGDKKPERRRRQPTGDKKPDPPAASALCPTVKGDDGKQRPMTAEECRKYLFEDFKTQLATEVNEQVEENTAEKVNAKTWGYLIFFIVLILVLIGVNFGLDKKRQKKHAAEVASLKSELETAKADAKAGKEGVERIERLLREAGRNAQQGAGSARQSA